jgi:hypothetical protein
MKTPKKVKTLLNDVEKFLEMENLLTKSEAKKKKIVILINRIKEI